MMPGMNPRKMQQMMKQLGIQQVEIAATEVIIRTSQKDILISNPSVQKVNAMGKQTFQVSGEVSERARDATPEILDEDVQTVMEQGNCSKEQAKQALVDAKGDLAEAIMAMQN